MDQTLRDGQATIGVIGLGYVGLPLAVAVARSAFAAIGFDIDPAKPPLLNAGTCRADFRL